MSDLVEVVLASDDDGHDFLIPAEQKDEFDRLLELGDDDDFEAFNDTFSGYRLGGALCIPIYAKRGYESEL